MTCDLRPPEGCGTLHNEILDPLGMQWVPLPVCFSETLARSPTVIITVLHNFSP